MNAVQTQFAEKWLPEPNSGCWLTGLYGQTIGETANQLLCERLWMMVKP